MSKMLLLVTSMLIYLNSKEIIQNRFRLSNETYFSTSIYDRKLVRLVRILLAIRFHVFMSWANLDIESECYIGICTLRLDLLRKIRIYHYVL